MDLNKMLGMILFGFVGLRSVDLGKENDLINYVPRFEQGEVEPGESSAFLNFEAPLWYNHDITYVVSISEMNLDNWMNDAFLFSSPPPLKSEVLSYLKQTESLWKQWTTFTTKRRIHQLTSLTPGSFYRVKYSIQSKYSTSQPSITKFIPLKRKTTSISLFVRGTGRNHHNNAQVLLNNDIVFSNGKYQGLSLIVLSRHNLKIQSVAYFDTYNYIKKTETLDAFYEKYSYDSDNNVISERVAVVITKESETKQAELLLNALKQLKPSEVFILVSSYGWERYFTTELAEYLTKHGALKIKELNYAFYHHDNENAFTYNSLLDINKHHHPYALVGIPFIGAGNGYEVIQSNKGHYLSTDNLPYAEVLVKLSFDKFTRSFSLKPLHKAHYNFISHLHLHHSLDFSLKNLFPLLVNSNMTTFINAHFNIYELNTGTDHLMPSYVGCYQTELERVVLGPGQCSTRAFFNGEVYQSGLKVEEQWFFDFFSVTGLNGIECAPPYESNGKECIDTARALTSPSMIVQCRIGISPQLCSDNDLFEKQFNGFN